MPQLFVPSLASEDKRIMLERRRLELIWLNSVTAPDKLAWLAQWAATPPKDSKGRSYQVTPRTAMNQTEVQPQVCYAWSQEFATLRFQAPPVLTPTGLSGPEVLATWVQLTIDNQRVQVTRVPSGSGTFGVIAYCTTPVLPGQAFNVRQFRLVAAFPAAFDGAEFAITAPLPLNPSAALGCDFYVRAFTVTPDNTLGPPHAPTGGTLV